MPFPGYAWFCLNPKARVLLRPRLGSIRLHPGRLSPLRDRWFHDAGAASAGEREDGPPTLQHPTTHAGLATAIHYAGATAAAHGETCARARARTCARLPYVSQAHALYRPSLTRVARSRCVILIPVCTKASPRRIPVTSTSRQGVWPISSMIGWVQYSRADPRFAPSQ